MKVVLTAKSPDRDYCQITIDGFEDKPHNGISLESTKELASQIQKVLLERFTHIDWKSEYYNCEIMRNCSDDKTSKEESKI